MTMISWYGSCLFLVYILSLPMNYVIFVNLRTVFVITYEQAVCLSCGNSFSRVYPEWPSLNVLFAIYFCIYSLYTLNLFTMVIKLALIISNLVLTINLHLWCNGGSYFSWIAIFLCDRYYVTDDQFNSRLVSNKNVELSMFQIGRAHVWTPVTR